MLEEAKSMDIENDKNQMVTLESLSSLTGFPVEMIKHELFNDADINGEKISLDQLRSAMVSYIDETMLTDEK